MTNRITCKVFLWVALFGIFACADGFSAENDHRLKGFDHLFKVAECDQAAFDPDKISSILDYVSSETANSNPDHQGGISNSTFGFHGFDVDGDLSRFLKYCFNPDIPACAVVPSEIRLSTWTDLNGKKISISPAMWQRLDNDKQPVMVRGVFYVQNTPEQTTGAYYGYTSYRLGILMKYNGRNVLISVMKQKDVSEVGKKGYALGTKNDPDYFYSGEQGLTLHGLSWVKSYLYDSCSVSVYIEKKNHEKGMRCGIFKWIRGGWAGNNIIRSGQLQKGLERYAGEFKYIMESRDFPNPDELADIWTTFNTLSSDEMKKNMIQVFKSKCAKSTSCPSVLKSDQELENYVNRMSRIEMSSTLIVDYVRHILAKQDRQGKVASRRTGDSSAHF